jgi:heat shock protein HtpX
MVSLYDQESANRRNSILLVIFVMLVFALFGYVIGYAVTGDAGGAIFAVAIAVGLSLVSALASYYGGDSIVLNSSQAEEISRRQAPELFDVVTEMATAAGVPMPRVYIIDDPSPNAFATGRDPEHASVAVTSGLLRRLDREELQGVLGHEMSHVRNYDIRFSLLVGVLVGGITLLAQFFLRWTFWFGGGSRRGSGDSRDSGLIGLVFLLVGLVLSILAPVFAVLVRMAVSRQREYLADASSVELTRNPYGLERALATIASDPEPLAVANGATQHMYIVNPLKKVGGGSALFSTHPPIVDRINRLRQLTGEAPLDVAAVPALAGLD